MIHMDDPKKGAALLVWHEIPHVGGKPNYADWKRLHDEATKIVGIRPDGMSGAFVRDWSWTFKTIDEARKAENALVAAGFHRTEAEAEQALEAKNGYPPDMGPNPFK